MISPQFEFEDFLLHQKHKTTITTTTTTITIVPSYVCMAFWVLNNYFLCFKNLTSGVRKPKKKIVEILAKYFFGIFLGFVIFLDFDISNM